MIEDIKGQFLKRLFLGFGSPSVFSVLSFASVGKWAVSNESKESKHDLSFLWGLCNVSCNNSAILDGSFSQLWHEKRIQIVNTCYIIFKRWCKSHLMFDFDKTYNGNFRYLIMATLDTVEHYHGSQFVQRQVTSWAWNFITV